MTNNKLFFIINPKLTYVSVAFVLQWGYNMSPTEILGIFQNKLEEDIDNILMFDAKPTDKIMLIGYDKEITDRISSLYTQQDISCLPNIIKGKKSLLHHVVSKISDKSTFSRAQMDYLKFFMNSFHNDYTYNETYYLNVIFYNVSIELFIDHFRNGWNDITIFKPLIRKHLLEFSYEQPEVYSCNGVYFVMGSVKYIGDYFYKYSKKYDNIVLIDIYLKKVYFKELNGVENKLLWKMCEKFCENPLNLNGLYIGEITKEFLALTKKIERV